MLSPSWSGNSPGSMIGNDDDAEDELKVRADEAESPEPLPFWGNPPSPPQAVKPTMVISSKYIEKFFMIITWLELNKRYQGCVCVPVMMRSEERRVGKEGRSR